MNELLIGEPSFISCVMVTTGRVNLLKSALKSYLAQTYSLRELIVVSQGSIENNIEIKNLLSPYENIHFLNAPASLSLGAMRNLSIELAHGDVICQWDDDDFYHPNRLMSQFKMLGNNVAVLYTQYLKYFMDTGKIYLIDHLKGTKDYLDVVQTETSKKFLCGSIMFKKSCFYDADNRLYPERGSQSGTEEDLNVLQKLIKVGAIASVTNGYEYCYVYHGKNVYDRRHHEMLLHKKHIATAEELFVIKSQIEKTLQTAGIIDPVNVCTAPIVDLLYNSLEEQVVFKL